MKNCRFKADDRDVIAVSPGWLNDVKLQTSLSCWGFQVAGLEFKKSFFGDLGFYSSRSGQCVFGNFGRDCLVEAYVMSSGSVKNPTINGCRLMRGIFPHFWSADNHFNALLIHRFERETHCIISSGTLKCVASAHRTRIHQPTESKTNSHPNPCKPFERCKTLSVSSLAASVPLNIHLF